MSTATKIEWTRGDDGVAGATWNPVTGCTKVSAGCDHCYAETFAERWRGVPGHPFEQGFDVRLWPDRLGLPLRWRRPRRVFVNSMSDLFHRDVPDEFIARVWAVMAATPRHTFQVLTKRHGRMRSLLSDESFMVAVQVMAIEHDPRHLQLSWPLPNVWVGVSVEDQQRAELRIPVLLGTPAAVRFLSCEPLLGRIDLAMDHDCGDPPHSTCPLGVDWVIVGGESGPGARPMHPDWARSLRDQCTDAGVAFFFKQWGQFALESAGAWVDHDGSPRGGLGVLDSQGRSWTRTPLLAPVDAVWMRRVGKGRAGRELDGRTWDEFPMRPVDLGVAGG